MAINTKEIVKLYTVDHFTMEQIGRLMGVTRQAVHKRLKSAGVMANDGQKVLTKCGFCHEPMRVNRKRWRSQENVFCNLKCAGAFHSIPGSYEWRHGSRLARVIVERYFPLTSEMIVHHKDGDERNNDLANLAVYANQSEHMKLHHGRRVDPVWDGAGIPSGMPVFATWG